MAICQYCRASFNGQADLRTMWAERRRRQELHLTLPGPERAVGPNTVDNSESQHDELHPSESFDQDAVPPSTTLPRHTTVEDIADDESEARHAPEARYSQAFPPEKQPGFSFGESPTRFEHIRNDEIFRGGHEIYGPQADNFLKLPIVR